MSRKTFKKKITSEEHDKSIYPENFKISKRFLREKGTRVSPLTVINYGSDLRIFYTWNLLENGNKFFVDIKKIEFADFFSYCVEELQWGSARANRMRSTLSSFSQFIEKFMDESYPDFRNVILKVIESAPKSERREKTILSDEQVERLLEHLSEKNPQQACWLALAISSGARFAELLRFEVDMIDDAQVVFDGVFIETSRSIQTKGRGRTGKMMKKYIIKDMFMPHYERWIIERAKILEEKGLSHNHLFIRKNGEKIADGTVRSWTRGMGKFLGENLYPHSLRHYITTYLSKKGIPQPLIKELMGWASIEMVSLYDDTSARDKNWKELKNLK